MTYDDALGVRLGDHELTADQAKVDTGLSTELFEGEFDRKRAVRITPKIVISGNETARTDSAPSSPQVGQDRILRMVAVDIDPIERNSLGEEPLRGHAMDYNSFVQVEFPCDAVGDRVHVNLTVGADAAIHATRVMRSKSPGVNEMQLGRMGYGEDLL